MRDRILQEAAGTAYMPAGAGQKISAAEIESEVRQECADAMEDDFQAVRDEFMELMQDEVETALAAEWAEFARKRRPAILAGLMNERAAELEEMLSPVREAWKDRIRVAVDERMAGAGNSGE